MATFDFTVTLVSEQGVFNLDSSYGSDSDEAFEYFFCNQGGTEIMYDLRPCLKDGHNSPLEESSFVDLSWNSDSRFFEGATPDYEIESVSGDEESGWEYTVSFLAVFSAQISASDLEEATDLVWDEAFDLEIYDGVCGQVLEVEDVRISLKENH